MSALDFDALSAAERVRSPFDLVVVPGFVKEEARRGIARDFPAIDRPGSFPVSELSFGPSFGALLEELRGQQLARAIGEKFAMDLTGRPTMITVRGRSQVKDGRIHKDSRTKILTVLIYLNPPWSEAGGRLRLLRSEGTLEDFAVEVKPENGNLVAFPCGERSWHGHTPFVGERRVVQLNWVTSEWVVGREQARHRLSARLKRWTGWWRQEAAR